MNYSRTSHELENRRLLAVERVNAGYAQTEVAHFLGVAPRSVRRWMKAYREGGLEALKANPRPGRPPKLTPEQTATVLGWFQRNPTEFGFRTQLWTARRVTQLIQKHFGVTFNSRYTCAWLAGHAITPQKPKRRPRERDPVRIASWIKHDWPRILKKGPTSMPISF